MKTQQLWNRIADVLDRAALFCRRRSFPWPRRDDLTQRTRWHANATDGTLDQYLCDLVRYCTGQKCNEPFMRQIETAGRKPISEADADAFRKALMVELTISRYLPLGEKHGQVGWSRHLPHLMNKIEMYLNPGMVLEAGDPPAVEPANVMEVA